MVAGARRGAGPAALRLAAAPPPPPPRCRALARASSAPAASRALRGAPAEGGLLFGVSAFTPPYGRLSAGPRCRSRWALRRAERRLRGRPAAARPPPPGNPSSTAAPVRGRSPGAGAGRHPRRARSRLRALATKFARKVSMHLFRCAPSSRRAGVASPGGRKGLSPSPLRTSGWRWRRGRADRLPPALSASLSASTALKIGIVTGKKKKKKSKLAREGGNGAGGGSAGKGGKKKNPSGSKYRWGKNKLNERIKHGGKPTAGPGAAHGSSRGALSPAGAACAPRPRHRGGRAPRSPAAAPRSARSPRSARPTARCRRSATARRGRGERRSGEVPPSSAGPLPPLHPSLLHAGRRGDGARGVAAPSAVLPARLARDRGSRGSRAAPLPAPPPPAAPRPPSRPAEGCAFGSKIHLVRGNRSKVQRGRLRGGGGGGRSAVPAAVRPPPPPEASAFQMR